MNRYSAFDPMKNKEKTDPESGIIPVPDSCLPGADLAPGEAHPDLKKIFRDLTFHRIQLLLKGIVDPNADSGTAATAGAVKRQHYWLYPFSLYREGYEKKHLHKGSISLRVINHPSKTPYVLHKNMVYYKGENTGLLAIAHEEEKSIFYVREGKGEIVCFDLNNACPNRCAFCARLKRRPVKRFLSAYTEKDAVKRFMDETGRKNLHELDQVSVVTGCFLDESLLVSHVHNLLDAVLAEGFQGDFYLASHELRSRNEIEQINARVPNIFYYALTVEHFGNRGRWLDCGKEKEYIPVLQDIREITGRAYYNYILGLDPYPVFVSGVEALKEIAIPYVSVFSVYLESHENLYAEDALSVNYYLNAYRYLLIRFGNRIYMHTPPFYNVSNRALLPFPVESLCLHE